MSELNSLTNGEIKVLLDQVKDDTIVLRFEGRLAKSTSIQLLDSGNPIVRENLYEHEPRWHRVVFDLRELRYINSTGGGIFIRFYREISNGFPKTVMLVERDSLITTAFQTIGFFGVCHPNIVWDDYDDAINA